MAAGEEEVTGGGTPGATRHLFLGVSAATAEVHERIHRAARVDATVLICGESGVGKELVAREIHARSMRRDGPFVPLNCAAIPETLIEAELFGHERGAFTDAKSAHRGAFELADSGTLFLDEVGDLSPMAQPKLLRALESAEIMRVGAEQTRKVDLRILAATNQNLKAMCREQRFRPELYYRLTVLRIDVPPLRERREDIPFLAAHFAGALCRKMGREFAGISDDAVRFLQDYHWPGNVRELKSAVERALALSSASRLDRQSFELDPMSIPGFGTGHMLAGEWKTARREFEEAYARRLLRKHRGNVAAAADEAGVALGSLYKMLRRLGLDTDGEPQDEV